MAHSPARDPETTRAIAAIVLAVTVLSLPALYIGSQLLSAELELRAMSRLQARAVGASFDSLTLPPEIGVLALEGDSRWYGMRYPHEALYGENTNQRACWISFLVDADGIVERVDARTAVPTPKRWSCVAAVEHYERYLGEVDPASVAESGSQRSWVRITPPEPDPQVDHILALIRDNALRRDIRELVLPDDLTTSTVAGTGGRQWHWVRYEQTLDGRREACRVGFEVDAAGLVTDVQRRRAAARSSACLGAAMRLVQAWHSDEPWYVAGSTLASSGVP